MAELSETNEHAIMSTVRERLVAQMRRARREKGFGQADLADRVGGSLESISKIERGLNAPSVELFAKIVEVLDIDPRIVLLEPSSLLDDESLALEGRNSRVTASLSNDRLAAWLEIGSMLSKLD